jgi:hypothetical protein
MKFRDNDFSTNAEYGEPGSQSLLNVHQAGLSRATPLLGDRGDKFVRAQSAS